MLDLSEIEGWEELSEQERLFVVRYLETLNAAEAARLASYGGPDSSRQSLASLGHQVKTRERVAAVLERVMARWAMTKAEALVRMTRFASASMSSFLVEDGEGVRVSLNHPEAVAAHDQIRKVEQKERIIPGDDVLILERTIKIELHDAKDAVAHLLRVHGAYQDRLELTSSERRRLDALREEELGDLTDDELVQLYRESGGTGT